jgi:hypothetical protein
MEEEHGGAGLRAVLGVPAQFDLRAVVGGRVVLAGCDVGWDRLGGARGADDRLPHGPAPGDVADGGWGEARLGHRHQRRGDLGIKGEGHDDWLLVASCCC